MEPIVHIGVHESVDAFPPERLCDELADIDARLSVVGDDVAVGECDALVTLAHRDAFLEADLAWVHLISAGVDHVPVERYAERGVVVTNSSGVHGECMGENVVGLMITLAHRLDVFGAAQARREWLRDLAWAEKFTLGGERACVVGLGAIGRSVAEYADALGMRVVGVRRTPEAVPGVETVYPSDRLREAISDVRFVVLCVPLTDETRGLISTGELRAMREDAYLVNVSRGGVVDETALVDAIREGELAGAALDVFEEEPLPPDSPLWDMDEVFVTPHVSGAFRDYYREVADLVRENVSRLAADEAPINRVA